MKARLFSVLLVVSFQHGLAQTDFQPGYILTMEKDSVKGLVYSPSGKAKVRSIEFKANETAPVQAYEPGMVMGFGYYQEDRYYQTLSLTDKTGPENVFGETLLRGKADLYYYDDFFYLKKNDVVEKIGKVEERLSVKNGERFVYAHKIYIGILNRNFSDCLPEKLLKGEVAYNERDFVEVFKKYSECSGSDYYVYKTPPQSRKVTYYLLAGFNNSRLTYPDDLDIFKNDNNFFIGGGMAVPLPFFANRISLTGEITYHRNVYEGRKEGYTPSGLVGMKDYIFTIATIKLPIGLRYSLSSGKIAPYLGAGVTAFFNTDVNWQIEYEGQTQADYDITGKTANFVIWGGVGLDAKIHKGKSLFFEFRLDKWPDFVGFYGPNGGTNIPSEVFNKMLVFGVNF
jgi:hypothetical protein